MLTVASLVLTGLSFGLGLHVHRTGRRSSTFPPRPLTAVVLGARVHPDGTPSPALIDRVAVGVALLREGRASRLLFSGGSPDGRPTEAAIMARVARELGATDEALSLEPHSRSTFENAARSAQWLSAQGEREILLVTCDFHLARAAAHFRTHGLTVWPVASRRSLTTADRLMVTGKELAGLIRRPWLITRL
jgi:uncharacterized SAM-binding protein YcdF (DUF218 family)